MRVSRARVIGLVMVLACAGSWIPIAWLAAAGHPWQSGAGAAVSAWVGFPWLFAVIFVQAGVLRQPLMEPLGITFAVNRWWLLAWLLPALVLLVALLSGWAVFGIEPVHTAAQLIAHKRAAVPPDQMAQFDALVADHPPSNPFMLILYGLPAGLTFNALVCFGEELGLRGFLFREVPGGFWTRSLWIGLLWGVWSVPEVLAGHLFPHHRVEGAALMMAWCVLLSPSMTYLRVRCGSVIPVAIFRGTLLALTRPAFDLMYGAGELVRPFHGATGFAAFALLLAGLWVHDRYFAAQRLMPEHARPRDRIAAA
ncbi:MAG: hypothetical protein KC543_07440 [Myxococcales bacterium]|nr:hypothetical protein [Myxococcales bacterium]